MPILFTPKNQLFAVPNKALEQKIRTSLGQRLFAIFGEGPFDGVLISHIFQEAINWYSSELSKKLDAQIEATFFQAVFRLHEMALKQSISRPNKSPIPQINDFEFALYSKALRIFLEYSCKLKLTKAKQLNLDYLKSQEDFLDEILVLAQEMYRVSSAISLNKMVFDSVKVESKEGALFFVQDEYIQKLMNLVEKEFKDHRAKVVITDPGFQKFRNAILDSFKVDINFILSEVVNSKFIEFESTAEIHDSEYFENIFSSDSLGDGGLVKQFFSGLTMSRDNVLEIGESVYRSLDMNRLLFRPILRWNVDKKDIVFFGSNGMFNSINKLSNDAVGWGKLPDEWRSTNFETWVAEQQRANDKYLENEVQNILEKRSILFDRNITRLRSWSSEDIPLENDKCGEIDFIFILDGKIFICEIKHLVGRYDMNSQYEDHQKFKVKKGKKESFNGIILRKIEFMKANHKLLEEHFQVIKNDKNLKLPSEVFEGIYVINTSTLIMYNNEYSVYNIERFQKKIIEGVDWPNIFVLMSEGSIIAKYPYFRTPFIIDLDDDGLVDEYGFPV